MLRYFYRTKTAQRHIAVFVRQADDWYFDPEYAAVRQARERAVTKRWKSIGVTPLLADYFIQSSQFVYEVGRRRELDSVYASYNDRLVAWEKAMEETLLRRTPKEFAETQTGLQEQLEVWSAEVRSRLVATAGLGPNEHFGLHLWVREPGERALLRLGSSVRISREPATLQRVPISRPTQWVAVETFCSGTPVIESLEQRLSRWNCVMGLPVFIDGHDQLGRLPVGVLTLASTAAGPESGLVRMGAPTADAIATYLCQNAAQLLTPSAVAVRQATSPSDGTVVQSGREGG